MGNICQSKATVYPYRYEKVNVKSPLPAIIVTSEDAALIYFGSLSNERSRENRNILKRKFPTLISFGNDKIMLKQIEMMRQRKCYLIIGEYLRTETMKLLIQNPKIRGIYFSFNQFDLSIYPKSSKIKGIYPNHFELKRTIFNQMRNDENHSFKHFSNQ